MRGLQGQAAQQLQAAQAKLQSLTLQLQTLKADKTGQIQKDALEGQCKLLETQVEQYRAETERMKAETERLQALIDAAAPPTPGLGQPLPEGQ